MRVNGLTAFEHDRLSKASFIKGKQGGLLPKWDWYQATVPEPVDDLIESACSAFPDHDFRPERGIAQYDNCVAFYAAGSTDRSFEINFGGNNDAPPNVKSTGSSSRLVVPWLRKSHPVHRVTRMDSQCDVWGEGLADQIFEDMDRVLADYPALTSDDRGFHTPQNGRTLYMGAPTSRLRVRGYEKGIEQGLGDFLPHGLWFRLEAQIRPPKKADGFKAAYVSALDAWGMSRWSKDLLWAIMQRDPEPYEWTRRVKPTDEESVKLLLYQRRAKFRSIGEEAALRLVSEMFGSDFQSPTVDFVDPDGEVFTVQGSLL